MQNANHNVSPDVERKRNQMIQNGTRYMSMITAAIKKTGNDENEPSANYTKKLKDMQSNVDDLRKKMQDASKEMENAKEELEKAKKSGDKDEISKAKEAEDNSFAKWSKFSVEWSEKNQKLDKEKKASK